MRFVVFGAGGQGREVMEVLRDDELSTNEYFFCESVVREETVNDVAVIGIDDLKDLNRCDTLVHVALGDPIKRRIIVSAIMDLDFNFFSVVSKRAKLSRSSKIGIGSYVGDFVVISPNVVVGAFCLVNYNSSIAHDVTIGDFTTISPGANVNGNVEISSEVFIGSNAVIRNGSNSKRIEIGSGSVIGAGSVVTKDVKASSTVVGNPARLI